MCITEIKFLPLFRTLPCLFKLLLNTKERSQANISFRTQLKIWQAVLLRPVQADATLPLAPHSPIHLLAKSAQLLVWHKTYQTEKYKPFQLVIFQLDQFPALVFHVAAQTAMPARTEQEHTVREGGQGPPAGTDAKNLSNTIFGEVVDPQKKYVFKACLTRQQKDFFPLETVGVILYLKLIN